MTRDRIVSALDDLLSRQAGCLKAGDLMGAMALAPGLERLTEGLVRNAGASTDRAALQRLAERAAEHADLIDAARNGVSSARDLLERKAEPEFQGYDASGRPLRIGR